MSQLRNGVCRNSEVVFCHRPTVAYLPIPELVENQRRSIAIRGTPRTLDRDQDLKLLGELEAALLEPRKLRTQGGVQ